MSFGTFGSGQSLRVSISSVAVSPALIVPCTATCPRDGSSPVAFSGKRKIVYLSTVYSVASKRIVGTRVR